MSKAKFLSQISFNSNDWHLTRDKSGRTRLIADQKGVLYRTNRIVTFLTKAEMDGRTVNGKQLTNYLKKIHPSYSHSDLSAPLNQLAEARLLLVSGKGVNLTYSLAPGAAATWKRVTGK